MRNGIHFPGVAGQQTSDSTTWPVPPACRATGLTDPLVHTGVCHPTWVGFLSLVSLLNLGGLSPPQALPREAGWGLKT